MKRKTTDISMGSEKIPGWEKLGKDFYMQEDVVRVSQQLIGKILVTAFDNIITAGRIVETEAYAGVIDKASHAWNGRRTQRTEVMYATGGTAYVYLCYGIHHLFNVVTNNADIPHAVLIRSIEPVYGMETMLERTGKKNGAPNIGRGPGNVSKALGILTKHTGLSLLEDTIWIVSDGVTYPEKSIQATPRIGVDYAGEDALLPYRFVVDQVKVKGESSQKRKTQLG